MNGIEKVVGRMRLGANMTWMLANAARAALTLGFAICGASLFPPVSLAQTCDTHVVSNDEVRNLRVQKRLPRAERLAREILNQTPDDFRANYSLGLTYLDQGENDQAITQRGIDQLLHTAALLGQLDVACAKRLNAYSILNTLGATYFNMGNLVEAEKYFRSAYVNRNLLNDKTRAKLLANVGLLFFTKRDYACSAKYYQKAVDAGNQKASTPLELAKSILHGANSPTTCVL